LRSIREVFRMRSTLWSVRMIALALISVVAVSSALAQNPSGEPKSGSAWQPMSIAQNQPPPPRPAPAPAPMPAPAAKPKAAGPGAPVDVRKGELNYKEVSDFFNIREANAN